MTNRWYWSEKAYCHLAANVRLVLKELGLEEDYHKYHALDAIVLIENKSEIQKCLEMAEQIPDKTCFGSVRVVKMDQAGISQIKKILSAPTTNVYDAEKAMCAELFKDISLKRGRFTGRLIEDQTNDSYLFEDEVFLGLDFDLLTIKNFTRKVRNRDGSLPRIVIYPEQIDLFSKLTFSGEKIIQSAEQFLVLPHR